MNVNKLYDFQDGSYLAFDQGNFDNFRVSFYTREDKYINSPTDVELLTFLKSLNDDELTWKRVTFLAKYIHEKTNITELNFLERITNLQEQKYYYYLAAAMIAEERKDFAILKKRVKLLGIHQVIIQDMQPREAANWSKGKRWRDIEKECIKHGF
jgi:hypothetical protein